MESQRDSSMVVLVDTKTKLEEQTTQLRDDFRRVLSRAERAQTMKLLNLQLYDLHLNEEATKTAAKWANLNTMTDSCVRDFTILIIIIIIWLCETIEDRGRVALSLIEARA